MNSQLVPFALIIAATAAIRSTWSPCGLSMLSVITPMSERGRGRRFAVTSAWFIIGAILGGSTLGLIAVVLAVLVHSIGIAAMVAAGIGAMTALVCAGSDLKSFGFQLPGHTRQVNEYWLDTYRGWVYGAGFGWQIGVGVSTYIMTAAVYLTVILAALTASPIMALAICTLFGLLRGMMILLTFRVHTPERLRSFHRGFARLRAPVRTATIAIELAVAIAMSGIAWEMPGVIASAVLSLIAVTARRSRADRVVAEPRDTAGLPA